MQNDPLTLASQSDIRIQLLKNAGLLFDTIPARIDELSIKESMLVDGASPRDVADALAEMKARKVAQKNISGLVLGCDQVLDFKGQLLSKPADKEDAVQQLSNLQANRHMLLSAAVIYENGKPVWRHIGQVRLLMRPLSETYIQSYVDRNWDSIQHSVGCYKLEEEGVRLFSRVEGDYFNVLGLPLLELISYLTLRGTLPS